MIVPESFELVCITLQQKCGFVKAAVCCPSLSERCSGKPEGP